MLRLPPGQRARSSVVHVRAVHVHAIAARRGRCPEDHRGLSLIVPFLRDI
jgi:hypothetical protein